MFSKTGDKEGKKWPGSLAARMTLWYGLSAFALVLMATGFLYHALSMGLAQEDDVLLTQNIQSVKALLRESPGELEDLQQAVGDRETSPRVPWLWTRILDASSRVVAETPGMSKKLPAGSFPAAVSAALSPGLSSVIDSPDRRSFRVLSAKGDWPGHSPPDVTVQMAIDMTSDEDILEKFGSKLLWLLVVSLGACALAGYWIAQRGIRPVREIAGTASRIGSSTLHERLERSGLPSELFDLAGTFNDMLDRLEASFTRLTRFSSDIAHELRTPIQNLRVAVEVALRKEREPEEYRDFLGSCLEEYQRLSNLIDRLLFLARAEYPGASIEREKVNLKKELELLLDFYGLSASESGIALDIEAPEDLRAELDRSLFQRAVGNLVENALKYTSSGGNVRIKASATAGNIRVEVSDTGRGIPEDQLSRVFDRFYRVDESRTAVSGGAGLGLSIVKSIMDLHGGTVEIQSKVGQGTLVVLFFPIV